MADGFLASMTRASGLPRDEGRRAYVQIAHDITGQLLRDETGEGAALYTLAKSCLSLAEALLERHPPTTSATQTSPREASAAKEILSAETAPGSGGSSLLDPLSRTLSPLYFPASTLQGNNNNGNTNIASNNSITRMGRKGRHKQRFSEGNSSTLLSLMTTANGIATPVNHTSEGLLAVSTFAYVQNALFVPPPRDNGDGIVAVTPQTITSSASIASNVSKPSSSQQRIPLIPISPLVLKYQETVRNLETATLELSNLQTNPPLDGNTQNSNEASNYLYSLRSLSLSVHDCRNFLALLTGQLQYAEEHKSITNLHPDPIAYHFTLIEHALYCQISSQADLLTHTSLRPAHSIQRCMDFFNYVARIVESSILEPNEPGERAAAIHCWMKIATRVYNLRNFSTLKAIISALGTSPISRLRKTWSIVPKKSLTALEIYRELLSEQGNYQRYRAVINNCRRPAVPFLGVFIYDLTYLGAAVSAAAGRRNSSSSSQINLSSKESSPTEEHVPLKSTHTTPISSYPNSPTSSTTGSVLPQDPRIRELIFQFEYFQTGPQYDSDPKLAICRHKSHKESYFSATFGPAPDKDDDRFLCSSLFCLHWILTQTFYNEKVLDDWSISKEPNKEKKKLAGDFRRKSVDYGMLGKDTSFSTEHVATSQSTNDVSSIPTLKVTSSSSQSSSSLASKPGGKLNNFLHAIGIVSSTSMPAIRSGSPSDFDDDDDDDTLFDTTQRRRSRSFVSSGDRLQKIVENVESTSPIETKHPPFSPSSSPSPPPPPPSYRGLNSSQRVATPSVGFHYRSQSSPALSPTDLPPIKSHGHNLLQQPAPPPPRHDGPTLESPDKSKPEGSHIGSRFRRLASLKPDSTKSENSKE